MAIGNFGRSVVSIVLKRGVVVAATLACASLCVTTYTSASEPAPSSVYSSCYPSTFGTYYAPYCYAQWDTTLYDASDHMYFFFGLNSTTVGSDCWQVYNPMVGSTPAGYHNQTAQAGSDSFFPRQSNGFVPEYDTTGYEMGLEAYGDRGTSTVTWVGIVKNT